MGSDTDTLTPWKCRNGHTLGVVQRAEVSRQFGGRRVRYRTMRLLLYRHAVDLSAATPEEVEVIANVEGTTLDVRCSCCDAVRSWIEGEEALAAMLRALAERRGAEVQR